MGSPFVDAAESIGSSSQISNQDVYIKMGKHELVKNRKWLDAATAAMASAKGIAQGSQKSQAYDNPTPPSQCWTPS